MKGKDSFRKLKRRDPLLRFRFDESLQVFRYLRGNLAEFGIQGVKALRRSAARFLKTHADLLGRVGGERLEVVQETQDAQGSWNLTLQQYHGAVRVAGGSVSFHVNQKGVLHTVNNRLFPDLGDVPRKPRISDERAIRTAQGFTKGKNDPERKSELLVYRYAGKPRLVWEVRLNDSKKGARNAPAQWIVYVDAVLGKVLFYYDDVQTAEPEVGHGADYYSGSGSLNA